MTDTEIIQLTRTIASPIMIALAVAIALRQADRVIRHRIFKDESPQILIRDVIFFWGLAFLLVTTAVSGAFGVILAQSPVWVVFSSVVGILLLGIIAVYEYRVIGRG